MASPQISSETANSRHTFSPNGSNMLKVIIPSSASPNSECILEMEIDPDTQIMDFLVRLCAQNRLTPASDYGVWAPTGVSGALEPCKASARIGTLRLDGVSTPTPVHYLKIALRRAQKARAVLTSPQESACPSPDYYETGRALSNSRGVAPFELTQRVLVTLLPLSCHKKCVVRASLDEPLGEILYRVCQELLLDARSCQFVHPRSLRSSVDALHTNFVATLDLRSNLRVEGLATEIYLLPPPSSTLPARYSNHTLTPRFPSDYSPILEQQQLQQSLHAPYNSTSTLCSRASIYSNRASTLAAPPNPNVVDGKLRQKPKMTDFLSFKKGLTLFHRSSMSVSQSSGSPQTPLCDVYKQDKNACDADSLDRAPSHNVNQASSRSSNSSSSHSSSPSLCSSTAAPAAQANSSGRNRRRRAPLPPPLTSNNPTELETEKPLQDTRSRREKDIEDDMRSYSSGYHGSSMSPSPAGFEKIETAPIAKNQANPKIMNGSALPLAKKKGAAPKPPTTIKECELAEGVESQSNHFDETQHQYDTIDKSEDADQNIMTPGHDLDPNNPVDFPQNTNDTELTKYENVGFNESQAMEKERSISPENIYENVGEVKGDDSFGQYERQMRGNGNINDNSPGPNNLILGEEGDGDVALTFINSSFTTTDTSSALYSEVKRSTRDLNDSIYSNISDHLKEDGGDSCYQLEFDHEAICRDDLEIEHNQLPYLNGEERFKTMEKHDNVIQGSCLTNEPDDKLPCRFAEEEEVEIREERDQASLKDLKLDTCNGQPSLDRNAGQEMIRHKLHTIELLNENMPYKLDGQKEPSHESNIKGTIKLEARQDISPKDEERNFQSDRNRADNSTSPSQDLGQQNVVRTPCAKSNQNVTVQKKVSFFKLRTADVSEIVKRARNIPITEDDDAIDSHQNQKLRAKFIPKTLPKNTATEVLNAPGKAPPLLLDPTNERPWTMTTLFRSNSKCQPNNNTVTANHVEKTVLKQTPPFKPERNINESKGSTVESKKPSDLLVEPAMEREINNGHQDISPPQNCSNIQQPSPYVCENVSPKEPCVNGMYTKGPTNSNFSSVKSPAIRSSLYSKFNSILSTLSLSSSSCSSSSNNTLDHSETKSCQENNDESPCDACLPKPTEFQARDELLLQIRNCGGKAFLKKRYSHGATNTLFQSN